MLAPILNKIEEDGDWPEKNINPSEQLNFEYMSHG